MSVLEEVLATKREEVAALRPRERELRARADDAPPVRPFAAALRGSSSLAVIGEAKRRSPSKGPLAPGLDVAALAAAYARGGAAAMSVLTDGPYFGGALADLGAARSAPLPLLRKDFLIDPLQVLEARAAGADAVLLIVAALDDPRLRELAEAAAALDMDALVEVHTAAELECALASGAGLVGVNSRDLATFSEDLDATLELAAVVPDEVVTVAESAVRTRADAEAVARAGYDAALVGEALVRSDDPAALLAELSVPRPARSGAPR